MSVADKLIQEFWHWFRENSASPLERLEVGLEGWMDRLAVPDWEIGPLAEDDRYLAISPAGDPDKYAETKHIVAFAPSIRGWKFLPARPKKDWDRTFLWSVHGQIDANLWKVVCFRYPDGLYELAFLDDTLPQLSPGEKLSLAELVIAGEIGEEASMTKICKVTFETEPTDEMIEASMPVRDLAKAIL